MTKVDDMIDTIHADVMLLPRTLKKVAGYVTGTPDIQWTANDWEHFSKASKIRLSQRPGEAIFGCDAFDIEDFAWTISEAIDAAKLRKEHGRRSTFYFPEGMLNDVETAVRQNELLDWVDYWVANPSLSRDQAIARLGGHGGRIKAWQWAFPSTNPRTVVPGTRLTLAEANVDLSVTLSTWHPIHHSSHHIPLPKPIKKPIHFVPYTGGLGVALAASLKAANIHLTPAEAATMGVIFSSLAAYFVHYKATK